MENNSGNSSVDFKIRISILFLICCHNAGSVLLIRYSRVVLNESYSTTEIVWVSEVIKLFVSGFIAVIDSTPTDAVGTGLLKLHWLLLNSRKIIVLVVMYSLSNILGFYALERIEANTFTVLNQLRILATALFTVWFLGRVISGPKWRALVLLVLGCTLVASPAFQQCPVCSDEGERSEVTESDSESSADKALDLIQYSLGIIAILGKDLLSGFTSVYFEAMLKTNDEQLTIWERNFQLAFYSTLFLMVIFAYESSSITPSELTLFSGWSLFTWLIAVVQSAGGLLVAACLKYADSILKTLATSGSIVLSAVLEFLLLERSIDGLVVIGSVVTILSIFNYTLDQTPVQQSDS